MAVGLAATIAIGFCQTKPIELPLSKLLVPTGRGLAPSREAMDAAGKRVRLEGFMALMEEPPAGGFWLCPSPVFQDESGAGTGDLPPNSVFVVVRGAGKKPVAHLFGKLAMTGTLSIRAEAPRMVLTLDTEKDVAAPKTKGSNN